MSIVTASSGVGLVALGSCLFAILVTLGLITHHLRNYRKPFEQRLIIRIIFILPLFALTCYIDLIHPAIGKYLTPLREIYEAFVIYTFFSLLTHILGGERNIIVQTSGREPVAHPPPMNAFFRPFDISDPYTFLGLKRGILQYVWLKPLLVLIVAVAEGAGWYDATKVGWKSVAVWTGFAYNASVTLLLYDLALFWKCLWSDLKPFAPMGKFLCVKMIIFASYWQGFILAILNWAGWLATSPDPNTTMGATVQNALLCFELAGFAIGHWYAFSYIPFTKEQLPNCGRFRFLAALRDCLGAGDLAYDFRVTFSGSNYDYRLFDSVEAMLPTVDSRMRRINQGMRYTANGKKYWLDSPALGRVVDLTVGPSTPLLARGATVGRPRAPSDASSRASIRGLYSQSIVEDEEFGGAEFARDDALYHQAKRFIDGDPNCPVVIEIDSYLYSNGIKAMRERARESYAAAPL